MSLRATEVSSLKSVPLEEIKAAQSRLRGHVVRTPLVRLNVDMEGTEVYLKLENLQNTGSFKQRGAGNAILCLSEEELSEGVHCPSSGNFAQGAVYMASRLGTKATIIAPDTAPETKMNAVQRNGGVIMKVPYDTWWRTMETNQFEGISGTFVPPENNRNVIAGNGTIGLEILEDLPDVDVIVTAFGCGGLITGVASAVKAIKPSVEIIASEVAIAAPLTAARAAGKPTNDINHQLSFIDGIGAETVLPEMWNLVEELVDGVVTSSLREIAGAVKLLLERNNVLAEGAGAAPVAAALSGKCGGGKIVAVVSGGNIDLSKVSQILQGKVPN